MRQRRAQHGLTLIEVAVTLTVLALLLAAVAPGVSSWMRNLRIRNAAESIQNGLQRARIEAVRRNENVMFALVTASAPSVLDNSCALSANAGSWVISLDSPATRCGAALSDTTGPRMIEKFAAGGATLGVSVTALQSDGTTAASSVTFDGFGRVASTATLARVDLDNPVPGNDFRPLRVLVTNAGSVRMCEPRVTDTSDPRGC